MPEVDEVVAGVPRSAAEAKRSVADEIRSDS
jgi:hypothetical protein